MRNAVAQENKEPCVWRSVSPNSPSPSLGHETFAAQPHQFSNFHTRFASHAAGLQPPRVPIRPTGPDSSTSEGSDQSDFSFWPSDPGTSSSGLSRATAIVHPQTTRENVAEVPISGYTRPYIKQLERPIQETLAVLEDVGGNNKPDEMDLTLKL